MRRIILSVVVVVAASAAVSADWPMWGGTPSRNMVSDMKGLPTTWDVKTGKNVKWVAELGSQSYGNPTVADGVVIDEARFPGRQGRLLFAYLVAEQGRPVPRDELAEALWGDRPPATWDKALSVIVSKVRGLLTSSGVDGQRALTGAFGRYLRERASRPGRNADMRPKRRERSGLRRDGLRHIPEDQRFGRRQGEQNGIDELLRIGRVGDQRAAAQTARG